MLDCWESNPSVRPSFVDLTERLGNLLLESSKLVSSVLFGFGFYNDHLTVLDIYSQHYIEMNEVYMRLSTKIPPSTDILSLLTVPNNNLNVSTVCDKNVKRSHSERYTDNLELKSTSMNYNTY